MKTPWMKSASVHLPSRNRLCGGGEKWAAYTSADIS